MVAEIIILFVVAVWEIIWRFPIKTMKKNEKIIEDIVNEKIRERIKDYYGKQRGKIDKLVKDLVEELIPLDCVTRNIRNFRYLIIVGILLMITAILCDLIPDPFKIWLLFPGLFLGVFIVEIPILIIWDQGKVEKYIRENNGGENDKTEN